MSDVVTRFAPSPTGYLHGGNYRTAVFAYLFAKKTGGKFIVRIEDTDTARSKKEYEENIIESLHWLKLEWDVMYRQSDNTGRYKELLEKLIAEGKAYVSKEEAKEEGGRAEVIRFKNPKKVVSFVDVIRGEISIDTTDLGDFVIARSITEPVFHFAVVVDDSDEGVTHVVRGEDHISNTPRQMLIAEALGRTSPIYAHLPLVLGTDRSKLSKRRGAKALTEYRDQGYLPDAMLNYLALLGWHPENEQEVFTLDELVQAFTLERIQKSSGIFDDVKLKWFNQEHLKKLTLAAFTEQLGAFITARGGEAPLYLAKAAPMLKERVQTFGEAWEALQAGEFDFFGEAFKGPSDTLLLQGAKAEKEAVIGHFTQLESLLGALGDEGFTSEGVKNVVFPYATEVGRASVLWPMRVALSGKEKSPDPFTLAAALGKTVTLGRIAAARASL